VKPFKSSYLKLERGLENFKTFHAQFKADYESQPLATDIRVEGRLGGGIFIADLIAEQVPDIRLEHSAAIGDVVNNFRAALDHAVWRLVKMWGARLTPVEEQRVAFPMTRKRPTDFGPIFKDRVPGVPDDPYRAFFERYQPYHRTVRGRTMKLLRGISDRDKHRIVLLSYPAPSKLNMRVTGVRCKIVDQEPPPTRLKHLKPGAPLARLYLLPTGPDPTVKMEGRVTISPTFERGKPVIPSLKSDCSGLRRNRPSDRGHGSWTRTNPAERPASLGRLLTGRKSHDTCTDRHELDERDFVWGPGRP
jgi:hypothetical protein